MEAKQFAEIVNSQLLLFFPEQKKYVEGMDPAVRRAWAGLFEDVEPEALEAACRALVMGKETISAYEREQMASKLLRLCREHSPAAGRLTRPRTPEELEAERAETARLKAEAKRAVEEQSSRDLLREVLKKLQAQQPSRPVPRAAPDLPLLPRPTEQSEGASGAGGSARLGGRQDGGSATSRTVRADGEETGGPLEETPAEPATESSGEQDPSERQTAFDLGE